MVNYAKEAKVDPVQYFPQALSRVPSMMQLLMSLKHREIGFEEALGHEHFQDILIDKRLWMIALRISTISGPFGGSPHGSGAR